VAFGDLRGFTPFAQTADPRRMLEILRSYHEVLGPITTQFAGTVERFTGDGIMVYFDDSPVADQVVRAVEIAVRMREAMTGLCHEWRRSGYELDYSMGVALGFAVVGVVGFPGRYDYAAIGPVTNLSSRLCARALPGQILISQGVYDIVSPLANVERVTGLELAGFASPVTAFSVRGLRGASD
jgi:adenylate cyclase